MTSWSDRTWKKWLAPIAGEIPNGIMRVPCIRRRGRRAKNVRETVRPAAGVDKKILYVKKRRRIAVFFALFGFKFSRARTIIYNIGVYYKEKSAWEKLLEELEEKTFIKLKKF